MPIITIITACTLAGWIIAQPVIATLRAIGR
jgi:hypothetical protein